MRIVFCASHTKAEPWLEAVRQQLPGAEVAEWAPGGPAADHAIVWSPPQALFDDQPGLKGIFNMGAGVDALLKLKLPPQAVLVRLNDAGMSVQMAEFVCQAAIRHFREFDVNEREMREGRWAFRKPRVRSEYPVGVMGLGVLGERVAKALTQFDFDVLGWSRSEKRIEGIRCFDGDGGLGQFLAQTRILVCLLPLTPETTGILHRETFAKMIPAGYLINVARGAHLVEEDLLAALASGQLAGATLDVFRTEPLPAGHPFWNHAQITLTPHTSARTLRDETVAQIADKIRAFERGEPIAGVVDRQRGY
jgi:glyoxylate/hydroxypyruvate reductase A